MLIAIHALDGPDAPRARCYAEHKMHLQRTGEYEVQLVIGGPLLKDDGYSIVGSLMVFQAESVDCVRRYNEDDPFVKHGVWQTVHISILDRKT